ncbi:hypothetical protein H0H93_003467 [Arthromyces matolae]|nr:hypothetical protein H0H93_003467 [Arthromyces matolae]
MADMALARLKPSNTKRHDEISKLRDEILSYQNAHTRRLKLSQNQVDKLPVEILSEVFRFALLDDPGSLVRLLRVCSYWRNVAKSTPALWESLVLTSNAPRRKFLLWLQQSKGRIRELHIRTGVTTQHDWPYPELVNIVWNQLRVCSAVSWDLAGYVKKNQLGEHALASLQELEMIQKFNQRRTDPCLFPLLKNTRIRALTFENFEFSWREIADNVTNLTSLTVQSCGQGEEFLMRALEANPGLEIIKILVHIPIPTSPLPPLSLSNLTHVELKGYKLCNLLVALVAPNLRTLIIRASGPSDCALRSLVANNVTQLSHLVIDNCSMDPTTLSFLLQKNSSLTNLEITSCSWGANAVVESLAGPISFPPTKGSTPSPKKVVMAAGTNGTPILCPALTHLNVTGSPDVVTGPLVRLVKSRMSAAATLATYERRSCADTDSQDETSPPKCARITSLIMDNCHRIEAEWLPWFREKVQTISCVYETKQQPRGRWR